MAWFVVPALEDLREQLNKFFPNRDKSSDGGIGDTSHAAGTSSHNPDDLGSPEWDGDPDSLQEVRARDFDVDLNYPGVDAIDVVRHLVAGAKSGRFWWIRYIIYDKKIYHKNNNFNAAGYSGKNAHQHHFHVNNDFSQAADTVKNVDYHLEELVDMPLTNTEYDEIAKRVWDRAYGTNSTALRFPTKDQSAANYNMLGAIFGFDAVKGVNALATVVAGIAEKVDLDPAEVEALRVALDIPTAEENADAVLEALGGVDTSHLATTLRSILTDAQRASLIAALSS